MIKLGIIGMSEGNGHPYSWSAIINGYDQAAMAQCPFPVIPDYLGKQTYPDDFISGAKVTHIWTQDREISTHIAKAAKIETICDHPEDMIGDIEAVLLARDDYQNHEKFAAPFLKAGLPVYIDKPLANSLSAAQNLLALAQSDSRIYTCSALRYARELEPLKPRIEDIQSLSAHTPKSWSLYAIHIIEPVIALLGEGAEPPEKQSCITTDDDNEAVSLNLTYKGKTLSFKSAGTSTGTINFTVTYKDGKEENIIISDMFYAFRTALYNFLQQIKTGKPSISRQETLTCMQIIEMGKQNV